MSSAALEYTANLKRQYQADGAFFVIVAANGNGTAGLRAHAAAPFLAQPDGPPALVRSTNGSVRALPQTQADDLP